MFPRNEVEPAWPNKEVLNIDTPRIDKQRPISLCVCRRMNCSFSAPDYIVGFLMSLNRRR
jgi:hypothetical protein